MFFIDSNNLLIKDIQIIIWREKKYFKVKQYVLFSAWINIFIKSRISLFLTMKVVNFLKMTLV